MRAANSPIATVLGLLVGAITGVTLVAGDALPQETIEIGITPQFVFDNYIVDNY